MKPPYKYCHIVTTLKLEEDTLVLDVPFKCYAQTIVYLGKDITRRLHDIKAYEGKEVVACVAYSNDAVPYHNEVDESAIAEKFIGYLGHRWEDVKVQPKYLANYSVTKEDKYATYSELGVKVPYDGIDKAEVTKFRQFDEEVEAINEVDISKMVTK